MWLAFALVTLTCAATVFMIRFLIALLREGTPAAFYRLILACKEFVDARDRKRSRNSLWDTRQQRRGSLSEQR
jgi:hypothetical protein